MRATTFGRTDPSAIGIPVNYCSPPKAASSAARPRTSSIAPTVCCVIAFPIAVEAALVINSARGGAMPYQCVVLQSAFDDAWVAH